MTWKALAFGVIGFLLLLVVMFHSGAFMHGDPVEPPPIE